MATSNEFNRPISDFPKTTVIRMKFGADPFDPNYTETLMVPTSEVFHRGSLTARRFSCTPSDLLVKACHARGRYPDWVAVIK